MLRRSALLLPRLAAGRGLAAADATGGATAATRAAPGPGSEATRPQDVQQPPAGPQQRQQLRWQSAALPQPAYASDDEGQAGGSSRSSSRLSEEQQHQLRDYRRRLEEMQWGGASSGPASAESQQQPQQQQQQRIVEERAAAWPTPQQVAERLRSSKGASCSSAALPQPAPTEQDGVGSGSGSTLDWREVVERVRASQQDVSGEQMLTDTYGRRHSYLRISLTERCNLRCLYCMPEEGVDLTPSADLLSTAEVLRLARLFAASGVDKVRLTGGEPTLRSDLVDITAGLRALPGIKAVGLTSNGLTLGRKLPALKQAGLSLLNISLDTLQPERFVAMTRRQGHERVLGSIRQAVELGFNPVKVNVVVMRGVNEDEVPAFVELTRGVPVNVRFIEYMPFDGNVWSDSKMVPYRDLLQVVQARYGELERCADPRGEVAKNFKVPGFCGSVSFITSMTKAFCSDCNRLRVMADGNLKVCLFGANEVSLRDAMREGASDADLRAIVSAAVDRKRAAHAGMFELAAAPNRAMVKIGG
ncbi:hypothetical protein ABPG75_013770 [Micractinium tetrahymenae]